MGVNTVIIKYKALEVKQCHQEPDETVFVSYDPRERYLPRAKFNGDRTVMETIPEALPEIDYPKSISENSSILARGKRDSYQDSEIKSIFPETSPKSVKSRKFWGHLRSYNPFKKVMKGQIYFR